MSTFKSNLEKLCHILKDLRSLENDIISIGRVVSDTLHNIGEIFFSGNGGSAADSQHLAAEPTGRFVRARRPLAAIALFTDISALTCISNNYSFDEIFARQVFGLGRYGDVLS